MAVLERFYNWQYSKEDWSAAQWNVCSPNLVVLHRFLLDVWGGKNLGCHLDRTIVGGSTPSSHAYGAGADWGWDTFTHNGPGRSALLSEVIPFLIDNSAELGVQAIHDYQGSRIWRPPYTSGRGADGWRTQGTGSQMGRDWARWIHVEVHKDFWGDSRPVTERLDVAMWKVWGPNRVVDSRSQQGVSARLTGGKSVAVLRPGFMPAGVKAYDAHVTVINPIGQGFLTVWANGVQPEVAQVNYPSGPGATNVGVTIPCAADGSFRLYTHRDCDVTVDVVGYFR